MEPVDDLVISFTTCCTHVACKSYLTGGLGKEVLPVDDADLNAVEVKSRLSSVFLLCANILEWNGDIICN
jgi:hypothetical protein